MTTECRSVLKACMAQIVVVDVCGNPVTGATNKFVTKGFIQVVATEQIETGAEITQKNACGELIIDEKDDDLFKRYDLQIDFCSIDPGGLSIIAQNARALVDSLTDTRGFAVGRNIATKHFSLELWTKIAGQTCDVSGNPEWYYFAIPHIGNGLIKDFTFDDGPLTLHFTGSTKDAGENWGQGPSCVLDSTAPALTTDHLIGYVTSVQPPDPTCGLQAVNAADLVCA